MSPLPPDDSISKNRANLPEKANEKADKKADGMAAPKSKQAVAAAIKNDPTNSDLPQIIAAGRGKWAEQILEIAFAQGLKVREDPALAEILATIELDSPIPTEAIMAVAEILAYVYEAEGQARPDTSDPFKLPDAPSDTSSDAS